MDSKVKKSFWTDCRVEPLPAEQKFALLWLMTNTSIDNMGFTRASKARFCFETSLPDASPLEGALKGLHGSFVEVSEGVYFAVNYIRHQFGKGGKISLKNLVIISIIRQAATLPDSMQTALLEAYPELKQPIEKEIEKLQAESPLQGGPQGVRAEKNRVENMKGGVGENEKVAELVLTHPNQSATAPVMKAAREAMHRHGFEAVLKGTKAYRDAVDKWPDDERLKFVTGAERFFNEDIWNQDPKNWRSRTRIKKQAKPSNQLDLGGRKPRGVLNLDDED